MPPDKQQVTDKEKENRKIEGMSTQKVLQFEYHFDFGEFIRAKFIDKERKLELFFYEEKEGQRALSIALFAHSYKLCINYKEMCPLTFSANCTSLYVIVLEKFHF